MPVGGRGLSSKAMHKKVEVRRLAAGQIARLRTETAPRRSFPLFTLAEGTCRVQSHSADRLP